LATGIRSEQAINGQLPQTVAVTEERHAASGASPQQPDHNILARCCAGDRAAFQVLVTQLMRPAYYHALSLVGNHDDAMDVSQEAFARAWHSIRRYDPARSFYAWYYVILKRQALNLIRSRHRRREVPLSDGEEHSDQSTPDSDHGSATSARLVSSVLLDMSLEDREIICMKDMHDLAYKEIAMLLGIPIGTVMSRLYAARGRFRQKMQETGYE
jgi:RNA polymerase sigma-70 factor, ECF subfamily